MFSPNDKKPGDVILSADWNASMQEVARLETDKVNRQGEETLSGSLTIENSLTVNGPTGIGKDPDPDIQLDIAGKGGETVDLQVNGRLKSNSNDGGLWISDNRFVGGFEDKLGLWNGGDWKLAVQQDGNVGIGTTHPKTKLEVIGDILSGSVYEDKNKHRVRDFNISIQANFEYTNTGLNPQTSRASIKLEREKQNEDASKAFSYTYSNMESGLNTVIYHPESGYKTSGNHTLKNDQNNWDRWAEWLHNNASLGDIVLVCSWDEINTVPSDGPAEDLLTSILARKWVSIQKSGDADNFSSGRTPWMFKCYCLAFIKGHSNCLESLELKGGSIGRSYYGLLNPGIVY